MLLDEREDFQSAVGMVFRLTVLVRAVWLGVVFEVSALRLHLCAGGAFGGAYALYDDKIVLHFIQQKINHWDCFQL